MNQQLEDLEREEQAQQKNIKKAIAQRKASEQA